MKRLIPVLIAIAATSAPAEIKKVWLISHCASLLSTPQSGPIGTRSEARYVISRLMREQRARLGDKPLRLDRNAEFKAVYAEDSRPFGRATVAATRLARATSLARLTRLDLDLERDASQLAVAFVSRGADQISEFLTSLKEASAPIDARVVPKTAPPQPSLAWDYLSYLPGWVALGLALPYWNDGVTYGVPALVGAGALLGANVARLATRQLSQFKLLRREQRASAAGVQVVLSQFALNSMLTPGETYQAHLGFGQFVSRRLTEALLNGHAVEELPQEDLGPGRRRAPDDHVLLVDHVMLKDEDEPVLVSVIRLYRTGRPPGGGPRVRWPDVSLKTPRLAPAF